MSETGVVKGFKVFNPDWTCSPNGNTKQYTCPGKFEEDITPAQRGRGMHFCKKVADCFNYYGFLPENKVAEVVAYGAVAEEGDKCCTNKLEIVREIPWAELLEIVNMGKGCTGLRNSGDWNSGDRNSGDCNSGDWNSGDCNSGDWNSGDWNSGNYNSGDWNSGNYNSGDWNSGNRNSGDRNSGDWNKCSFSNGCFNTTSPKICLFNKPSEWTYKDWLESGARDLLNRILGDVLEYVRFRDMTDEEKAKHPEAESTGGYLRKISDAELTAKRNERWKDLSKADKNKILKLPNFDAEIFKEITMIDVTKGNN